MERHPQSSGRSDRIFEKMPSTTWRVVNIFSASASEIEMPNESSQARTSSTESRPISFCPTSRLTCRRRERRSSTNQTHKYEDSHKRKRRSAVRCSRLVRPNLTIHFIEAPSAALKGQEDNSPGQARHERCPGKTARKTHSPFFSCFARPARADATKQEKGRCSFLVFVTPGGAALAQGCYHIIPAGFRFGSLFSNLLRDTGSLLRIFLRSWGSSKWPTWSARALLTSCLSNVGVSRSKEKFFVPTIRCSGPS